MLRLENRRNHCRALNDRLYDKDEIKRIIERASRLQQDAAEVKAEEGLTLVELQQAAAATGMDPAFIQQAAMEVGLPAVTAGSSTSTHLLIERIVPGTLSDDDWGHMLIELRRRFDLAEDDDEVVEIQGATRSWKHGGDDSKTQVYATQRDGAVHIRMSQKIAWADRTVESLLWAGIATVLIGTLVADQVDGLLFSVLSYLATFLATYPAVYGIDTYWRRSKQRDFDALAQSLVKSVNPSRQDIPPDTRIRDAGISQADSMAPPHEEIRSEPAHRVPRRAR